MTLMSEDEIIQLGIDISNALIACHRGDIHRDIKPANIFLHEITNETNPNMGIRSYLLGDFGISKIVENILTAETPTGTKAFL